MKVTKRIGISKEEHNILDKFFEMCDDDMNLSDEEIGDLVRAIYRDCGCFDAGGVIYDIEYTR